jgi:hypothetical protein
MVNFYSFYSARYFVSSYPLDVHPNYSKTVNLNSFPVGEVVSLVFPNFSKFRESVIYNFSVMDPRNSFFTTLCPFTKIVIPVSYLYAGLNYDFSWFLLFRPLSNSSNRVFVFAPPTKLITLPLFILRTAFFCGYYCKIRAAGIFLK